jgi:hypothetical protein
LVRAIKSSIELAEKEGFKDNDLIKFYRDKISSRLRREAVRELRRSEYIKYKKDPNTFKLPIKTLSHI